MTTNYHTAWVDGTTQFRALDMNDPISDLDSKITDLDRKEYFVACNYLNALPGNSYFMLRTVVPTYMLLPDGAPKCFANCDVAPTAQAVCTIKQNAITIGTITFGAGSTQGVFAVSGDKPIYRGHVLSIVAPASQDATFKDISITLKFTSPGGFESTSTTTTTHTTTSTSTTTTTTTTVP